MPAALVVKKWWQSKMMWTNLLVGVIGVSMTAMGKSDIAEMLSEGNVLMLISVVNMALRMITKTKLEIL